MSTRVRESDQLRHIRSLHELIPFLRDELDWPIESEDPEDITFDYDPKDLGIDEAAAVCIRVCGSSSSRDTAARAWKTFGGSLVLPRMARKRSLMRMHRRIKRPPASGGWSIAGGTKSFPRRCSFSGMKKIEFAIGCGRKALWNLP